MFSGASGQKVLIEPSKLAQSVVGQMGAVEAVTEFLNVGLSMPRWSKPWVCVLAGPCGVGKTRLVEAVSRELNEKLYEVNLGGFRTESGVDILMGSAVGAVKLGQPGLIAQLVAEHKGTRIVMCFEGVEKVHEHFWTKSSRLFGEGEVGDSQLEVKLPLQSFLFVVTNAHGDEIGRRPEKAAEILQKSGFFEDVFLSRVHRVVGFGKLNTESLAELGYQMTLELCQEQGIKVEGIGPEYLCKLLEMAEGDSGRFGGHALRKIISRELGLALACWKGPRGRLKL